MSAHSVTPASTPSLVNCHLASLLAVLEALPTADAALDVVEEWAQDLSPLVLAYRKALGAIRDEETELCVAAAVKQLAEWAPESWVEWARGDWPELATAIDAKVERRLEEQKRLAEEEARRVEEAAKRAKAAEECRLEDERRRKDEEDRRKQAEDECCAQEAADEELARIAAAEGLLPDPAPAGVDKGKGRARVDDEVTELSDDPSVKTPQTLERPFAMTEVDMAAVALEKRLSGQKFQQGCYFDKVRLGLEQDDLDALDLDDESRGIIRVIREERAHIARRRALLHDMDLDLQKMEKAALAKGGIGFVRGAVDDD
ncbi:predicted protein [Postia placenta Mad-698-R]|nr:predicted protein [Postia placenta Mad-698-R]